MHPESAYAACSGHSLRISPLQDSKQTSSWLVCVFLNNADSMSIFLPCMLIVVVNCPSPHDVVLVHGHRHHVHVVISGRSRGYIVCNAYYALNCVSFIGIPVWSISNGGPALPGLVQPKNLHSVCIASMNYKPAPVGFLKCYYACSTVLKAKKYDVSYHY